MKKDLEESNIQKEVALSNMKKKHLESLSELNVQMELQNKSVQRWVGYSTFSNDCITFETIIYIYIYIYIYI